jgi:hypothetical protein
VPLTKTKQTHCGTASPRVTRSLSLQSYWNSTMSTSNDGADAAASAAADITGSDRTGFTSAAARFPGTVAPHLLPFGSVSAQPKSRGRALLNAPTGPASSPREREERSTSRSRDRL